MIPIHVFTLYTVTIRSSGNIWINKSYEKEICLLINQNNSVIAVQWQSSARHLKFTCTLHALQYANIAPLSLAHIKSIWVAHSGWKRPFDFVSLRLFRWSCGISGFPPWSAGDLISLREYPAECGRLNMYGGTHVDNQGAFVFLFVCPGRSVRH